MSKARFQFEVSDERAEEIRALMTDAGIDSNRDLFNNALTLFEWAVEEVKQGNKIASVDERQNVYRELQMPALRAAATKARSRAAGDKLLRAAAAVS